MGTAIKIGLGILIGGILLIGACGLLVAAGRISRRTRGSRTPGGDTGGGDTGLEATGGDTGGSSDPTRSPQRTRRFSGKLYDQTAATTIEVVSVADGGSSSGGGGAEPSVSRDGRYVAFRSGAELASGDPSSSAATRTPTRTSSSATAARRPQPGYRSPARARRPTIQAIALRSQTTGATWASPQTPRT